MWHEEVGIWLDYDIHNGKRRDYFYPSNIAPLWTGSYDNRKKEYYTSRVLKYLDNKNVNQYFIAFIAINDSSFIDYFILTD